MGPPRFAIIVFTRTTQYRYQTFNAISALLNRRSEHILVLSRSTTRYLGLVSLAPIAHAWWTFRDGRHRTYRFFPPNLANCEEAPSQSFGQLWEQSVYHAGQLYKGPPTLYTGFGGSNVDDLGQICCAALTWKGKSTLCQRTRQHWSINAL
ncbi:uncharacterized protein FOMMEDRAFT_162020 [Fomitiporia mediterranea MF3/22]|uniref:uncharacterized protein n=1 Tax=Fomitiporia mediterranea (strain MF3/22) TaxID=694068 RepID=UPI00044084F6|nr:uncharacterized protein FOMMEDRAFT_162020 [Fomitiporia mediterranea MF3/22]EJC98262.1 hypothetical protein FOMMEDRAFT_162020 [Fomitiporia mediterranea MF3/22]